MGRTLNEISHSHDSERRSSRYSTDDRRLSLYADTDAFPEPQGAHFETNQPRAWATPVSASFGKIYRSLLGLKPFRNTYLSLYDPLENAAEHFIALTGVIFALAAGVPLPIIAYIFGKIINEFPPEDHALHQRLCQLVGVAIAYFAATIIYTIAFGLTAEHVSLKLRRKLLECLLYLDQAYLDTHDIDVNSLLTEKMDTIQAGCSEKVGIFIQAMSYFVAAFVVGFILDAKLVGILLTSVVPTISLSFILLSPAISRHGRAASKESEQANDVVESALSAVKVVQAFDMIAEICQRHYDHLEQSTRSSVKKATLAAVQSGAVHFIAYAANALAFYIGSRRAVSGNAGTTYAVVLLILDASFVVGQFAPFLEIFARAASAKSVIQNLLNVRKESEGSSTCRKTSNKPNLHQEDISFYNVEFRHPARPTVTTLHNINLTLTAGKLTALVGTSGGGKSTMIALLLGLYDYSGHINIGPHDVKSIDSSHLRSQIAVVDQDTVLLPGTVLENVCFGLIAKDLSEREKVERCKQALKEANVDFLDQLPHGLYTTISNELQLSGGQRQRLCLARALVKNPAILVLDEPTSALDARSEVAVMEAIRRLTDQGTTVIMIAHRLSTTLAADHVAVVSGGGLVEQGSPLKLSTQGTIFRGLLDAQNTNFDNRDQYEEHGDNLLQKCVRSQQDAPSPPASTTSNVSDSDMKQSQSMKLWFVLRHVGTLIKSDIWIVLSGILAAVICGGIALGQAIVFGNLIQVRQFICVAAPTLTVDVQLLNDGRITSSFFERADFFCLMFFILALIALAAYSTSGTSFGVTSTRLTRQVQTRLLQKLLHLDMQWFAEPGRSTHRLMEAFTKDPSDVSALGGVALGAIFTILTSIVGGIILALCMAWKIAIVLLAAVPVMLIAGYARLRILTASETKHREAYSQATSLAAEACRRRTTVTFHGLEEHILEKYAESLQQPYRQIRAFVLIANVLLALCFSITYFVYALAYWWGSKQVRNGTYSVREFFIVLPALLFSAQSAGQFFSLSPEIARAKTAARRISTLMCAESRIMPPLTQNTNEKDSSIRKFSLKHAAPFPQNIDKAYEGDCAKLEFSNVSLHYPHASRPSLSHVSLSISHGQTVALVGPSGAGKSTVLALLERFYDPSAGTVLYNGLSLRNVDVRSLRSHIGLVSQDPDLFSGSIAYNVKLGAAPGTTVSDDDVENVCARCGLHNFIMSLPEGYRTDCGSSSSSHLSGGQKQRLAIARALVRNPDVLLLDEVTSALDAHSEAHVQSALAEAAQGRTTVIVAHRLASIQHVDKIFVFDQSKVVAQGTHTELIQQCGLYASMAKAQSLA